MGCTEGKIKIRPLVLEDLKAIFLIDKEIRMSGKAITYENLTTEDIFTIDQEVNHHKRPISYIVGLLDFGFVAEIDSHICGFILGRAAHEDDTVAGLILILGVHPIIQRKGIATSLVNALCEKYRSKGIKTIRATIDQQDKDLLGFVEHMGFIAGHRVDYSKTL